MPQAVRHARRQYGPQRKKGPIGRHIVKRAAVAVAARPVNAMLRRLGDAA